jgi:hypothetical protein
VGDRGEHGDPDDVLQTSNTLKVQGNWALGITGILREQITPVSASALDPPLRSTI